MAEVFEAFIDPVITSKFWFTKGSDRLEPGQQIQWDWEMYNASVQVDVKAIEQNKHILIGMFSIIFPIIIGALVWGGLWLRDNRLQTFIPWRR